MIPFILCILCLFAAAVGQPPDSDLIYVSKDDNGHYRFTPPMCCQFCSSGEGFKNFAYTEGRCLHYSNVSNIVDLPISSIEKAHVLHVHRSSCCFFCGFAPDLYSYKKDAGHCELDGLKDSTPGMQCIVCESVVVAIKELIDSEKDAIKDQIKVYCDQTVVLRRWCRQMVETHLESLIFFIENQIHLSEICFRFVKACPPPDNSTLKASTRSTILDPRTDGAPMVPEELMRLSEITKANIDQFFHLENLTPELQLDNLKFLAKYGLIYNSYPCKACGGESSLIKQAAMLDGYVWRCSDCKSQGSYKKVSVRSGSFFFNLKKSFGVILTTAAIFIGDPTLSLDDISKEIIIERPTLIAYENYYLDVVQLIVTNMATNLVGGQNKVVDVERTIVYSEKYSGKLDTRKFTQCIIIVERGSVDYSVVEVANFDSDTLADAVNTHVRDGTKVVSTEFHAIGGASTVQSNFDARHPGHSTKFFEFDAVPVRSVEATKWNTIKNSFMEATKKNHHRASLMLSYILTRTSVKPFNRFLFGLSLYDPEDPSL